MTNTTLLIRDPRELLALVPHRLGFRPRESVVLLSLRPPRGRVGLVVRVDLADLADPQHGPALARALMAHLDRDTAERTVAVVYTEHDPRPGSASVQAAVRAVRGAAAAPFGAVPVWVVTSTGYLDLDAGTSVYPAGGRPLRDLEGTVVGAHMVLAGSVVLDRRQDLSVIRPAGSEARRAVARSRQRWAARGERATLSGPPALLQWRRDCLTAWSRAVVEVPSAATLGKVEAGLADLVVRDAILLTLLPGVGDLPVRSLADDVAVEMGRAMDQVYDDVVGVPPPALTAQRHERTLEQLVAHGRRGGQAPARTLLALLAWWAGDGARAAAHLERALDDDAGYRLAVLLDTALARGLAPGWARRELREGDAEGDVR